MKSHTQLVKLNFFFMRFRQSGGGLNTAGGRGGTWRFVRRRRGHNAALQVEEEDNGAKKSTEREPQPANTEHGSFIERVEINETLSSRTHWSYLITC